ncbi:type I site-specific deoxyribonuclease [Pasteurella bettyae]|nr:type I site-specific deoxyribonuclease [Pasteurella bettyae]
MEAILTTKSLSNQKYAIIIDEAHNSQTGSTASKLQATLAMESAEEMANLTVEELLAKIQQSRVRPKNISHFAFTATPKHSTFTLFGRATDNDEVPQSFHKYTMRQAIEEGFILDVLKGYISYQTAYQLGGENLNDGKRVNVKDAKRTLAKWQNLHATNVTQKVQFILAHFHHNVAHLLNGQAKAMVVTSSRPAAVRYKLAFEKYLKQQQYQDYRVLVAFSGSLNGSQIKHADDTKFGDIFDFADDAEFTESSMNPKGDLRKVFDEPEYRLMVVANKFQTGFDQPKLCAMYLDKKIANEVEVVQTLSRLNRTSKGKDTTFVVDFVNDPSWIKACFAKYDSGAEITEIQDPQVIYDIKDDLDKLGIYDDSDLAQFKQAKFATAKMLANNRNDEKQHQALFAATTPAMERFNHRLHQLQNELLQWENAFESANQKGDEHGKNQVEEHRKQTDIALKNLLKFKSNLAKFSRVYHYIAQLLDLGDPELENFAAFCKLLAKRLDNIGKDEIDVSGLILTGYAIRQNETDNSELTDDKETLRPISGSSGNQESADKKDYLSEIIKMLSSAFGDVTSTDDQKQFINHLMTILAKDDVLMAQIENNPEEIALQGKLPEATTKAIIQALSSHEKLATLLLQKDKQSLNTVLMVLYRLLKNGDSL